MPRSSTSGHESWKSDCVLVLYASFGNSSWNVHLESKSSLMCTCLRYNCSCFSQSIDAAWIIGSVQAIWTNSVRHPYEIGELLPCMLKVKKLPCYWIDVIRLWTTLQRRQSEWLCLSGHAQLKSATMTIVVYSFIQIVDRTQLLMYNTKMHNM